MGGAGEGSSLPCSCSSGRCSRRGRAAGQEDVEKARWGFVLLLPVFVPSTGAAADPRHRACRSSGGFEWTLPQLWAPLCIPALAL